MIVFLPPLSNVRSASNTAVATSAAADDGIPNHFLCPITKVIMIDPVLDAYGHSYEKAAIEQWLSNHDTCPVTGAVLPNNTLTRNHALRNAIEEEVRSRSAATIATASFTIPAESTNTALGDASSRTNRGGSTKKQRTAKPASCHSQAELDLLNDFDWDNFDKVRETVLKSVTLEERVNVLTKNFAESRKSLVESNRIFNSKCLCNCVDQQTCRTIHLSHCLSFRSKVSLSFGSDGSCIKEERGEQCVEGSAI